MIGILEWIIIIAAWNILGLPICINWAYNRYAKGLELYNPYYSYKYHKSVNWFGAVVLSLLYTMLCPIGAICYWFYKLCTIGRK
jgi:hypothetical protein